jgi:hypothetical protein
MDLVHQICNQPTKSDCSFRSMPIKKNIVVQIILLKAYYNLKQLVPFSL